MTRQSKRWLGAAAALALALVAAEVGLRARIGAKATVQIENEGAEPIEGLVVTFGGGRTEVGRVGPGATGFARVVGPDGPQPLVVTFRQRGNALGTYELPQFNPAHLRRDGMKQVIRIRTNEVERYLDEDDVPATPAARIARNAWQGVQGSLDEMASPE